MRLLQWAAAVAVAGVFASGPLAAQDTLRVLRHTPGDSAAPTSLVTITFDRPIAGAPDKALSPARLFHIAPDVPGTLVWRDPTTIRFTPTKSLEPGARYTITIDTAVRGSDGTRLIETYRYSFRVRGPRLLARSTDRYMNGYADTLAPDARLRLLYSSPLDLDRVRQGVRLELSGCPSATTVAYRVVQQRPIGKEDPDGFNWAGGYPRDSVANGLRRVVEIEPASPVPVDCDGKIVIPTTSDDSSFGREERYTVRTAPLFRIRGLSCACAKHQLLLSFSAPVRRADVLGHVRLNAQPIVVPAGGADVAKEWPLQTRIDPRSTFTVAVDAALNDVYGRPLQDSLDISVNTDDYLPEVRHAVGVITAPSSGAHTMPLRSVNVRSIRMIAYRVPDSARVRAMTLAHEMIDPREIARGLRPETTIVVLPDRLNVDTTTEIPLPPAALAPDHPLVVFRVDVREPLPEAIPLKVSAARHSMVLSWPERNIGWWWSYTFIQVTDLAVTARLVGVADGAALVTGLGDGRPRRGVTVTQFDTWGRVLARGVSDADGIAPLARVVSDTVLARTPVTLTPDRGRFPLVQAEAKNDRVIVSLGGRAIGYEPGSPLDVSTLGARFDPRPLASGAIFSDRGIYRPGDVVHVKGVVRLGLLGALRAPGHGDSARVVVRKRPNSWPDDSTLVVRDTVMRLSSFGTMADSLRLRVGLPLGGYAMDLKFILDGAWRTIQSSEFQVAEYRVPEFVVEMTGDTLAHFAGDTVNVHVHGRYYFGAPMRGAVVKWTASAREGPSGIGIPHSKGWTIGSWTWFRGQSESPSANHLDGVDTLDADGNGVIRVPTAALRAGLSGFVDVAATVTDVSRQVVGVEASVAVSASRTFILVRLEGADREWRTGEPATIDVRVADARGVLLRDAVVRALVVHERWVSANPLTGAAPHWTVDTVATNLVRTDRGEGSLTFTPRGEGSYAVEFSTADASGMLSVTTASYVARGSTSSDAPVGYRLRVTADRSTLRAGEAAHVHFDSPFDDAEAWITVEREGILEQRRQRARRGDNTFDVRATELHVPNVYVAVTLASHADPMVRPDSARERLRIGYIELHVAPDAKALSVVVQTDRASYGPRDTVSLRVHVRDADRRGVRSEVALWAVDQGAIALTGFATPNILSQLYADRGIGSQLWGTIPTLLTNSPELVAAALRPSVMYLSAAVVGSSAGNGAITITTGSPRSQFNSTAFYLGQVETNDRGDAVARASVPDNLTTFRVMAVAVAEGDRYGHGDTTFLVTRPLVARAALPRFIRPSDSLLAGVVVTPRDGRPRAATAELSAVGLALRSPTTMRISLSSSASTEARFVVQAPSRDIIGNSVTVRLGAGDGASTDATETRLPVSPDYHPRTHAMLGAVRDSQDVALTLPRDIDPRLSRLRLRIGTSPLSTMLAAYRWLRAYRFDCTEQISSTGRAMIAVWQATKRQRVDALGGDPREKLQELVGEVSRRQRADGGFNYWPGVDWTSTWLNAYVGLFLLDARDAGAVVDPAVIGGVSRYLRREADAPIDTGGMNRYEQRERRLALGDRVAAVDFLRRAGSADSVAERRLLALAPGMTWEDRLRLAELLAPRADARADAEALLDTAWRAVTAAGHRVDLPDSSHAPRAFPSRIAPAARLLSASLALRPAHPLLSALTETVLQQGRAESAFSWNTQDYASVVIALAHVADAETSDRVVRVRGGNSTFTARRPSEGVDTSIVAPLTGLIETTSNGARVLRLHLDVTSGDRPVYYALEVEEVPLATPVTPDIQGIVVERWYERFDTGAPVVSVKEGDLVRVRLRVTVPADRAFVAVEDPLPAGLEPIDVQLRTSAPLDPFATPEGRRAARAEEADADSPRWQAWLYGSWDDGHWSPWEHKELHDDRVSYFARVLWTGSYTASYVARATTAGSFVAPPAYAEEMYNPALQGRSAGGRFEVISKP